MTADQQIAIAIVAACTVAGLVGVIGGFLAIAMAWDEFRKHFSPEAELSGGVLFRRALGSRCPACGRGSILRSYLVMNESCPACHAVFWRSDGEWIGPAVINFSIAVEAAFITWGVAEFFGLAYFLQMTLPAVAAVGVALAMMPLSRSFWTLFLYINGEVGRSDSKRGRS
jgi:uncharacterized protein (DUF983 family)